MKITWLGHSAFKLEESTGTTVVTDPYHSYIGYKMPRVTADTTTTTIFPPCSATPKSFPLRGRTT